MKSVHSANDIKDNQPIRGNVSNKVKKAVYDGANKKYRGRDCTVHHTVNGSSRITIDGHTASIYVLNSKLLTRQEYAKKHGLSW